MTNWKQTSDRCWDLSADDGRRLAVVEHMSGLNAERPWCGSFAVVGIDPRGGLWHWGAFPASLALEEAKEDAELLVRQIQLIRIGTDQQASPAEEATYGDIAREREQRKMRERLGFYRWPHCTLVPAAERKECAP